MINRADEVRAMVEIESAQEILIRLAVAAVLRDDHPGDVLEHFSGPEHRPRLDQLRRDVALARGVRRPHRVLVVPDDTNLAGIFRLLRSADLRKKNRPQGGQGDPHSRSLYDRVAVVERSGSSW